MTTGTDGELLERMGADAAKWADEFNKTAQRLGYSQMDEVWLIGWFANAIEHAKDTVLFELDAAIARAEQAESDRDAALDAMEAAARKRGELESKLADVLAKVGAE